MRDTLWITQDGQSIPVKNMDDNHILNADRMVGRQLLTKTEMYKENYPHVTVSSHGESAYVLEYSLEEIFRRVRWLHIFQTEIFKRGLKKKDL